VLTVQLKENIKKILLHNHTIESLRKKLATAFNIAEFNIITVDSVTLLDDDDVMSLKQDSTLIIETKS
jgi:hypothetical protein